MHIHLARWRFGLLLACVCVRVCQYCTVKQTNKQRIFAYVDSRTRSPFKFSTLFYTAGATYSSLLANTQANDRPSLQPRASHLHIYDEFDNNCSMIIIVYQDLVKITQTNSAFQNIFVQ